ncbi:hypothetical protein MPSEU_000816800 [Mayamaea pseudoterrestris]|nr:hypothetical protein MPSEU_000816800 [Mayamaea pseudoterrestris]
MMQSGADDDDVFGANPFRSSSSSTFSEIRQPSSTSSNEGDLLTGPMVFQQQPQVIHQQQSFLPSPPLQPIYAPQDLSGPMERRQESAPPPEVFSTPFASVNRCLSCFRLDGYRPYFNLDTVHVYARIKAALTQFHLPDHFRTVVVGTGPSGQNAQDVDSDSKGPDLYGPLWITLTLVFVVAMTSNYVAARRSHHSSSSMTDATAAFEYDIVHLLRATSIITTFSWLVPTLLCVACACLGLSGENVPSWGMWMCVYGYSLVPFIPACLLLSIWPLGILVWIYLGMATAASGLLVVRNLCGPILLLQSSDAGTAAKATPILFSMLGSHCIFLLVLKVVFYSS